MAGPQLFSQVPPGTDPTDFYEAQRRSMLAQVLTEQALSAPQAQQGLRIIPKVGWGQVGAKLAAAMMARKANKDALERQIGVYQQGLNAFQPTTQMTPGTPLQSASPPANPDEQSVRPALQRLPGQSFDQTVQASQPQAITTPSPLNPQGMPPQLAMNLYQQNPAEYMKYALGPEQVQMGRLAGMSPQVAAGAAFNKANAIDLRAGGMVRLPDGQIIRAPNLPSGYDADFDPQGRAVGAHMVPGIVEGEAQRKGAETAAEVANKPMEVPMGGGKERLMYVDQVPGLGAPPALRGSNGASGVRDYFPKQLPPAAPTQTPPAQGPWSNVPKLNIPNTPGRTSDAYTEKILGKAADKHIELADKYGQESDLADQRIAFNREAQKVLQGADTGPLSDEMTKLRAKALEMGVPASWIPKSETVENTQELKKFLLRNPLLSLKPTFGGRPAASEFAVLKEEASPSPTMLKSTISKLIDLDSQQAQYVKQRAQDYGRFHEIGGDPTRFEGWYSNTHPFAKSLQNYEQASKLPSDEPKGPITKQVSGKTYYSLGGGRWSDSPP